MSPRFTVFELTELAMDIEKNGEFFYSEHAKRLPEGSLKDLFAELASQEASHYKHFRSLRDLRPDNGKYLDLPGNQGLYLKSLADENVFTEDRIKKILASNRYLSIDDILTFALDMEYSSIMFYNTLRPYLTRSERPFLDKIIDEEVSHMTYLEGLRRKTA